MRHVVLLALLALLPAGAYAGSGDSREQLRFGVDVARKGLWREARFRFERAVLLDPSNAAALNNLAIALEQQGEFAKAREAYDKALALEPTDTYIQQNYDLFREADDKRNRKAKKSGKP
jgi:Flp pilus assembly protein TadD